MTKTVEMLAWIGSRVGKPPGWERVVRFFAPPERCREMRTLCVVRDGLVFLAKPSVPIGWHVAFFGTYEPELRSIFRSVLPMGGVAIDVGANVGWHTLLMASLVRNTGTVLAVEPNPSVRLDLEANLRLNRVGQVTVIPCAASDSEGFAEFFGPDANDSRSGDGYIVGSETPGKISTLRVKTQMLDVLVAAAGVGRVDLIKIDVEGSEWAVLQGALQTIERFRPHVVFEYLAEYVSRGEGSPEKFEQYFQRQNYRLFSVGRNWAEEIDGPNWPQSANIWAVPF